MIVLFLVFALQVQGQDNTFHHYGLENGLSQQTVRCIVKDQNGFLWMGTQDGLNRFDGHDFKVYKHRTNDSLSISGNFINRLICNTDNTIWVATTNNGVCFYDPINDAFVNTNIASGSFVALANDTEGNVYAAGPNQGLVRFNKQNGRYVAKILDTKMDNITSIVVQGSMLYLGTSNGELFHSRLNTAFEPKKIKVTIPKGSIEEIAIKDRFVFLGTSLGLFVYDSQTSKTHALKLGKDERESSRVLFIESLKIKGDTFYIGTDNGFLICGHFDIDSYSFKSQKFYRGDKEDSNSITSNRVYDILVDNDLIWIGTNKLDVMTLQPKIFKTFDTHSKPALNNSHVFSILKTHGYTFIGTRNGLHCLDRENNMYLITKENTGGQLAYNVIRGMATDANNNLWLATTKGVSVLSLENFNPEKPQLVSMYFNENDPSSLSNNKTRGVYKDHKNTIWVTTYGGGLNRFTGNLETKTHTFEIYNANSSKNAISSDFVFGITQDREHNYWITTEDGFNKLQFEGDNYQNPVFTVYKKEKGNPKSLQNNTTLHTHIDNNNEIWVATQGGLHKFDMPSETFTHYGEEYGLTNNYVYSILEDADGFLWLSTNDGLFRFNKADKTFEQYTTNDGLQGLEYNLGAHFNDRTNNLLYFGGVNGYNEFDPREVPKLDRPGRLVFSSIKIKDTEINPLTRPDVLDQSINKTEEITLNHDDFPCYIAFSEINLSPIKNNQFLYALNDGEWNNLKNAREIQILELPKGNHTLKIQGKTRNQIWNDQPLQLDISVIPPWYKSNVAYLGYFSLCLWLARFFYKLSLQRQMAKQEAKRLKELDSLKSRFITNITHEFRTPLTLMLGHAGTLKAKFPKNKTVNESLTAIEQSGNNLLLLVNQMLDLAKLEQGRLDLMPTQQDLVSFTKQQVHTFSGLAGQKNIQLVFSSDTESIITDFDTEKWRQILANLLSNALKFTKPGTSISVTMGKVSDNRVDITVSDKGPGIPKVDLPLIFERFYQVENSKGKTSGTGIGLALTKELVELMGGTIIVSSTDSSGTAFTVTLPLKKNTDTPKEDPYPDKAKTDTLIEESAPPLDLPNAYTVLIVEDNKEIADFIGTCLSDTYRLLYAANGAEGLALAEAHVPDIILTDVIMPQMDGCQMTSRLQDSIVTNHIPVIMLTAKSMQEDKLLGIESGADVYLTKPFHREELVLRVEMLIAKRKKIQEGYEVKKLLGNHRPTVKPDKNLEFLETVIQHVHQNMDNPNYNALKLAADLHMSEPQLYRKLKAITNKSSAIFIRSVRLARAKELIEATTLTISEIAYATGFNDPNWFGKAFKQEFGINPSKIRNRP